MKATLSRELVFPHIEVVKIERVEQMSPECGCGSREDLVRICGLFICPSCRDSLLHRH